MREEACLDGVIASMQSSADDLGLINDDNIGAVGVIAPTNHIDQACHVHIQSGLFSAFTLGGASGIFPGIDEPGRQAPTTLFGLDAALDEKDFTILFNEDGGGYFGIREEDPAAVRTGWPLGAM